MDDKETLLKSDFLAISSDGTVAEVPCSHLAVAVLKVISGRRPKGGKLCSWKLRF